MRSGVHRNAREPRFDRVVSVGASSDQSVYRDLIDTGMLVPGGQILRGAGRPGAVLYNCFVTGPGAEEPPQALAARVTSWTRLGAGVGVNLDAMATRERDRGGSACAVIEAIARSQQRLWEEGTSRTATMVTLSLADPEVVAAAKLLTSAPHFRHLNLGVLVSDADLAEAPPVLDELARSAWLSGNPGFLFIDRVQQDHGFSEQVRACNPCGEQFLVEEEGCNLASLNLATFVDQATFNWNEFRQATAAAVRFLDDVIDASAFPSPESHAKALRRRRIGLGVLGFASVLHRLGLAYGGPDSISFAGELACKLRESAEAASAALALERGAYPDAGTTMRRNSHLLSVAPTGAISVLWEVSSGIEPVFGDIISKGAITVDLGTAGRARPLRGPEVPSTGHVAILAAWQAHVDGGISKTINLPESASVLDVRGILDAARTQGCKGVSIFRQNSRPPAVLTVEAHAA